MDGSLPWLCVFALQINEHKNEMKKKIRIDSQSRRKAGREGVLSSSGPGTPQPPAFPEGPGCSHHPKQEALHFLGQQGNPGRKFSSKFSAQWGTDSGVPISDPAQSHTPPLSLHNPSAPAGRRAWVWPPGGVSFRELGAPARRERSRPREGAPRQPLPRKLGCPENCKARAAAGCPTLEGTRNGSWLAVRGS